MNETGARGLGLGPSRWVPSESLLATGNAGSRMVVLICAKKTALCAGSAARDDKLDTRAEPCAPRQAYVRQVACRK